MKSGALVPYQLPSVAPSAGATFVSNFRDLPKMLLGSIAHLVRLQIRDALTLTFSAGTMTTAAQNQCIQRFDLFDGTANRFTGGFNLLRMLEVLQDGKIRQPDPANGTTTEVRYLNRTMELFPKNFIGAPSDGECPVALLDNAQINGAAGALADYGGTVSAATQSISLTAWLALREGEIRIPPVYEVKTQNVTGGFVNLAGRAAYDVIAALNSTSYDDFAAGDLANVSVDLGKGQQVPAIDAAVLGASFLADKGVQEVGMIESEPTGALDVNGRIVNRASITALTSASKALAPFVWSQNDQQITKLAIAESIATVKWSGTQTGSTPVITGRFLPQSEAMVKAQAAKAVGALGLKPTALKPKTLSKDAYAGRHLEFMPWAVKVAR